MIKEKLQIKLAMQLGAAFAEARLNGYSEKSFEYSEDERVLVRFARDVDDANNVIMLVGSNNTQSDDKFRNSDSGLLMAFQTLSLLSKEWVHLDNMAATLTATMAQGFESTFNWTAAFIDLLYADSVRAGKKELMEFVGTEIQLFLDEEQDPERVMSAAEQRAKVFLNDFIPHLKLGILPEKTSEFRAKALVTSAAPNDNKPPSLGFPPITPV